MRAQGYAPLQAAIFGVYLHGRTAEIAMKEMVYETFVASDCIGYLPQVFLDLFQKPKPVPAQENEVEKEKKA